MDDLFWFDKFVFTIHCVIDSNVWYGILEFNVPLDRQQCMLRVYYLSVIVCFPIMQDSIC